MSQTPFVSLHNGQLLRRGALPTLEVDQFRQALLAAVAGGARVSALFGNQEADGGVALYVVLAQDREGLLLVGRTQVGEAYPSLTRECPQVHLFEREIAEQYRVRPEGHPWLKPVRFAAPLRSGQAQGGPAVPQIGVTDFYRVHGSEVHEVAVGPVHAGVIEPGHFRFQCHGEEVFHLEISLGYQHRGIEEALRGGPHRITMAQMETAAGDTTIGHASAYCQNLESLSGSAAPARAHALRGLALELERLANHTGDLGALAGDVGFLPTAAYCGRIRGDFLNMSALLCGSRFGRGLIRPGGVGFDVERERAADLRKRCAQARKDVTVAVELLFDAPSVMARFENTGVVSQETGEEIGLVGPAARASGIERDVRRDHPFGIFRFTHIPVLTVGSGDVYARAYIRWLEMQHSMNYFAQALDSLPESQKQAGRPAAPAPDAMVVSLIEGWRGEICHVALTGGDGRFERYKIVNPSFHNWTGLALALRGQQISDFPLCNKSFNLSYCGHDL